MATKGSLSKVSPVQNMLTVCMLHEYRKMLKCASRLMHMGWFPDNSNQHKMAVIHHMQVTDVNTVERIDQALQ